jgi:epoxyqueuosine reductase
LELLDATDAEVLARWGRWYIAGRQARYVRRNALLVLANTAEPDDARARAAVSRALGDPDALLRAHAVWAAARLGLDDLVAAAAGDPAEEVRVEIEAAPRVASRRA